MTKENREIWLKRLKMRSEHRGIKEMDIILGRFADKHLGSLDVHTLEVYEEMLFENDLDIYDQILGRKPVEDKYADIIEKISNDLTL